MFASLGAQMTRRESKTPSPEGELRMSEFDTPVLDKAVLDKAVLDKAVRRRTLLKAGIALGASQIIAAPFIVTALGEEPVKIGMVNPLTGVLSALAQSEVDGAKYAEAEINKKGGILGR